MRPDTELNSKAIFCTTGSSLEIIVVAFYALMRVEQRFQVPDRAKDLRGCILKKRDVKLANPEEIFESGFYDSEALSFEVQENDQNDRVQ